MKKSYQLVKRVMDILLCSVALILLTPLFIVVAIAIKFDSKGPVIFKQRRIGIDNREFYILKFRTMSTDTPKDAPTDQLSNATSWITRTGRLLRKTSIDELPQLVNIVKGEMSIVGPRPALWNQKHLIKLRTDANVHNIKPGLTGWAQVNGRDENNDEEKVFWDVQYLNNISLMFDLRCILKTIVAVFRKEGVVEGGVNNVAKDFSNR